MVSAQAFGQVTQPDGMAIPTPEDSNDYFDTTRFNASTLSLNALFDAWEGPGVLDPKADAATLPATFAPLCGLRGAMVLRGGSCQVDFGWYCAADPKGQETIYPLVTAEDIVTYHDVVLKELDGRPADYIDTIDPNDGRSWFDVFNNEDKGFVPVVPMGAPSPAGVATPVTGPGSLAEIQTDRNFLNCPGGQIGFAIVGNPTDFCPQTKFSEQARNQDSSHGAPWINALIYSSRTTPGRFYVAFEDMPTLPDTFTPDINGADRNDVIALYPSIKSPNWEGFAGNDADFNDFVFVVDGLVCEGGGQSCSTGQLGICAFGVTDCARNGGASSCIPVTGPSQEICDNIDNDCDGVTDEKDEEKPLCPEDLPVCHEGVCSALPAGGEFACPGGQIWDHDIDLCVDPTCMDVSCPAGQRCEGGSCVGGCDNVSCPTGQECILGRCIDLCSQRPTPCPDGFVCKAGACIADCHCLACPAGFTCQDSGECVDTACAQVSCEKGLSCLGGKCVDRCVKEGGEPVKCPAGQHCVEGHCAEGSASDDDVNLDPDSLDKPSGPGAGNSAGKSGSLAPLPADKSGCDCHVPATRRLDAAGLGGLLLLGLGLARRRRPGS